MFNTKKNKTIKKVKVSRETYKVIVVGGGHAGCEAASAASVAGLRKLAKEGLSLKGKTVVCVITGTGLKEPELAAQYEGANVSEVQPDLESVEATLALATLPSASVKSGGLEENP